MKEKNDKKFTVIDLFAGAGGFGLGFEIEGDFQLTCSLEKDKWASETLTANGKKKVIEVDIKNYHNSCTIKSIITNPPNVIIGGPPCQGFSIAGPASKKDPHDPRNTLFKDFANWVRVLEPKVFIMENVKGLLSRKNAEGIKVIDIILKTFEEIGFHIDIWILNAVYFGVPQMRERVFIVGNRNNDHISEPKPSHQLNGEGILKKALTVGEAISDLPEIRAGEGSEEQSYTKNTENEFQNWARGNGTKLFNHVSMNHTQRVVERYKKIQEGIALSKMPIQYRVRARNGNGKLSLAEYNSNYRQLKFEKVSYTIPASFYSNFIHPTIPRNITAREAARLQSFPDWYVFKGKRTQISKKLLKKIGKEDEDYLSQYNQIGNAVPPILAKAIAKRISAYL